MKNLNIFTYLPLIIAIAFNACNKEHLVKTKILDQYKLIEAKNNARLFNYDDHIYLVIKELALNEEINVYNSNKKGQLETVPKDQILFPQRDISYIVDPETYEPFNSGPADEAFIRFLEKGGDNIKSIRIINKELIINGERSLETCITPLTHVYDENNNFRGIRSGYYLILDEVLPYLKTKELKFPDKNNKIYTWKDVFEKEFYKYSIQSLN